jgi:hypothetical protein
MHARPSWAAVGRRVAEGRVSFLTLRSAVNSAINPTPLARNDKGLPKKAFANQQLALFMFWLPDLGSNQGPTD